MSATDKIAAVAWAASRQDEGTISFVGAGVVARAVVAAIQAMTPAEKRELCDVAAMTPSEQAELIDGDVERLTSMKPHHDIHPFCIPRSCSHSEFRVHDERARGPWCEVTP